MVLCKLCWFYYESVWLKARITQQHLTKASHIVIIMTTIIYELENVYAINFERTTLDNIMYIVHFSLGITVITFVVLPTVLLNFYMQIFILLLH
jgi:hypothetical protein